MSFGTLTAISLFGSFIYITQNQACFSLLYTLHAIKDLIVLFYIHFLVIYVNS